MKIQNFTDLENRISTKVWHVGMEIREYKIVENLWEDIFYGLKDSIWNQVGDQLQDKIETHMKKVKY